MTEGKLKAYCVPLRGTITRMFMVYAPSADEARAIMNGDRGGSNVEAMDDYFNETGLGRITRMPEDDPE